MREKIEIDYVGAEQVWCRALSGAGERAATGGHAVAEEALAKQPSNGTPDSGTPVIGYASCTCAGNASTQELRQQASVIQSECKRRGLILSEIVGEREPAAGKGLTRPGLTYALERISLGEAKGLVVAELSRITYSAAELGTIIEWLATLNARFVAADHALDTACQHGQRAAHMLIDVSRWERTRLSERTRNGLEAARMSGKSTGRRAVRDDPDLSERITRMRAQGMTLQAIADRLNEEGVPTVRGGAKWRHSSVQAAAGYRRSQNPLVRGLLARDQAFEQMAS